MPSSNILVIGNCIIDEIHTLPSYPAEDDEVRSLHWQRTLGGNACNSARILAQLGHRVSLVSAMAGDALAGWALDQLSSQHICTDFCHRYDAYSTPISSIWLSRTNGSRTIAHYRELPELSLSDLLHIDPAQFDWIHLEGRNIEVLQEYLPKLAQHDIPLSLEIEKARHGIEDLSAWVNTIILSSQYLRETGISAENCLRRLRSINPHAHIVCTLGDQGLMAMDNSGSVIELAARPVSQVVDSIGAGDCFIAALISARLRGDNFADTLDYASAIAAEKIQHSGMTINQHE